MSSPCLFSLASWCFGARWCFAVDNLANGAIVRHKMLWLMAHTYSSLRLHSLSQIHIPEFSQQDVVRVRVRVSVLVSTTHMKSPKVAHVPCQKGMYQPLLKLGHVICLVPGAVQPSCIWWWVMLVERARSI